MTSIVVEEELGAMPAIEQILRKRGFPDFTISYVEAGHFTEGDYFAEVTQYTHDSVICTPRFGVTAGDEDFSRPFWTSTATMPLSTPPSSPSSCIPRWSVTACGPSKAANMPCLRKSSLWGEALPHFRIRPLCRTHEEGCNYRRVQRGIRKAVGPSIFCLL